MPQELTLARDLVLVLLAAFFGGVIAKKMKFPLIVGYLLGGMVTGSIINRFIPLGDTIKDIAEIGVALLLFTLGLEFTLAKMKEFGEVAVFGSFIQIVLTILFGIIIFPLLGMDFYSSLFLGAVASLSSTAVVVKSLSDRGELDSLPGRISAGWLFMQDLYTLPLMIILPAVGKMNRLGNFESQNILILGKSLLFSFLLLGIIIFLGRKIMPLLINKIADLKSRELILIAGVLICLIFSFLFQFFGFSFAIGAFIAGTLIGSSSARHGIFAEIRPLRDLFSVVFFVSLGFIINPFFLYSSFWEILLLVVLIILIKFIISAFLVFILGYHTKVAALVGVSLISVGEFAFILALSGLSLQLISRETYMTILSVSFITLVISAPLLSVSNKFYYQIKKQIFIKFPSLAKFFIRFDRLPNLRAIDLSNHVVVLGHGRVGKYICRALGFTQIPYLVVDYNHKIVKRLKEEGIAVVYGDPAEFDVLRYARVDKAKIVIMAYSDRSMQPSIISNILSLNPNAKVMCRTHFEEDQKKLKSLGVEIIIQPEFEAAISITEKLLRLFNVESSEIDGKITRLKIEHGLN